MTDNNSTGANLPKHESPPDVATGGSTKPPAKAKSDNGKGTMPKEAKPASTTEKKEPAKAKPKVKKTTKVGDQITLKVSAIVVDKDANPRRTFDREALNSMAATFKHVGVVNPLAVFEDDQGRFHLIAGERRLRAAKIASLKEVPCRVFDDDEVTIHYVRCAENMNHEQLNPLEEARALKPLLGKEIVLPGDKTPTVITNKVLAKMYKKSQAWVSQRFALLDMPQKIQDALMKGTISFVHARDLIALDNQEAQLKLFDRMVKGESSTKDLRKEADKAKGKRAASGKKRGRPTQSDGEAPNLARQSLDTALERLQGIKITLRGKNDVREQIATVYEKHDRSKSEDRKQYLKGVAAGLEWASGIREEV
jgi:ParB family chromosome partitioning protein